MFLMFLPLAAATLIRSDRGSMEAAAGGELHGFPLGGGELDRQPRTKFEVGQQRIAQHREDQELLRKELDDLAEQAAEQYGGRPVVDRLDLAVSTAQATEVDGDPLWQTWTTGQRQFPRSHWMLVDGTPLVGIAWNGLGSVPGDAATTPVPAQTLSVRLLCDSPPPRDYPLHLGTYELHKESSMEMQTHKASGKQQVDHIEDNNVHVIYEKYGEYKRANGETGYEAWYDTLDCPKLQLTIEQEIEVSQEDRAVAQREAMASLRYQGYTAQQIEAAVAAYSRQLAESGWAQDTGDALELSKSRRHEVQRAVREVRASMELAGLLAPSAPNTLAAARDRQLGRRARSSRDDFALVQRVASLGGTRRGVGTYVLGTATATNVRVPREKMEVGAVARGDSKRHDVAFEFVQDCRATHAGASAAELSPFCTPGNKGVFVLSGQKHWLDWLPKPDKFAGGRMVFYLQK